MKVVRSDSPEVARSIAKANVRVNRRYPPFIAFIYGLFLNALILIIAVAVSLFVSVRAAAWFGVPAFAIWNAYVLWLLKFSNRRWVIAVSADRIYAPLFMGRASEPHVFVIETSDVASFSTKTVEVFVYGPDPEFAEWLVIEPAQAIAEILPSQILSFLEQTWRLGSGNTARVGILAGRLT